MDNTDNINIFVADPDGVVPEEAISEDFFLLFETEEDAEDYPTDEEIHEIFQEIAESDNE